MSTKAKISLVFCLLLATIVGRVWLAGGTGTLQRIDDWQVIRVRELLAKRPPLASSILIFGDSSAAYSVDAVALPQARSFATVNGSAREMYFILRSLLASGTQPRCVVAALSLQRPIDSLWSLYVRNHFYSREELREIAQIGATLGEDRLYRHPWLFRAKALLYSLGYRPDLLPRLQTALLHGAEVLAYNRAFAERIERDRGSVILNERGEFRGTLEMNYAQPPKMDAVEAEYIRRFHALAHEAGIRIYWLRLPLPTDMPGAADYAQAYEKLFSPHLGRNSFLVGFPPFPPEDFIKVGHLRASAARRLTESLSNKLAGCEASPEYK